MFRWNTGIYMDEKVRKKPKYYRRMVESRKLVKSCYCVTLPANEENCMDIYSSREFWFQYYRDKEIEIIGLAADRAGAERIVCQMTQDVMKAFGAVNAECVKRFFGG